MWHIWLLYKNTFEYFDSVYLWWLAKWILEEAKRLENIAASERAQSWKAWAATVAMKDGTRLAHRFTRLPPPWMPTTSMSSDNATFLAPQEHADQTAAQWHKYWGVGEKDDVADVDWHTLVAGTSLPDPTIDELRHVGRTYSAFTSLGRDDLPPRHVCSASDDCLRTFIALIRAMFRLACVPTSLALLIIVLLPKPDGGNRPIGIFATCIRIIARWSRWKFASRWELGNPRQYWFGESGKACDLCVWRQSMRAEYAVETGR